MFHFSYKNIFFNNKNVKMHPNELLWFAFRIVPLVYWLKEDNGREETLLLFFCKMTINFKYKLIMFVIETNQWGFCFYIIRIISFIENNQTTHFKTIDKMTMTHKVWIVYLLSKLVVVLVVLNMQPHLLYINPLQIHSNNFSGVIHLRCDLLSKS